MPPPFLKRRNKIFPYIRSGEGKISVREFFDLGLFNLLFVFYCKTPSLVVVFITMDKLDKCWLVFEAFGINFPWKDIVALPENELDYIYGKAEEAKKRHEAQVEAQNQMKQQQMAAQAALAKQQGGQQGNIISPQQAYSFEQP